MSLIVPLIEALEKNKVAYVVVGGVAVLLHGHERLTGDIDIVLHLSKENVSKALDVLLEQGFKARVPEDPKGFADPETRERWIKEKNMIVFSFFHLKHHIFGLDVFVSEPVPFEELHQRSVVKPLGSVSVRVAGIDDLIAMKKKAGRAKDLEDIRWLEGIKHVQG